MKPTSRAVMEEANTVGALGRGLAVFGTPNGAEACAALPASYAQVVVSDEWPSMQRGQASLNSWDLFDDLFRTVATLETGTTRQETWMQEIFLRTNELLKQRRTRLYSAQAEVLGTLWAVVLIGATLSMFTAYVLPPTRFHGAMISSTASDLVRTAVRQWGR